MIEYEGGRVKAWVKGVPFTDNARHQVGQLSTMGVIGPHVAVMPDVHFEAHGATVGTVIPTNGAVIPGAVGVDPGCGVMAQRTTIIQDQLPDSLNDIYVKMEELIPVGRDQFEEAADSTRDAFSMLIKEFHALATKHPKVDAPHMLNQLGTVGAGNHFVELNVDSKGFVWIMVHSGSRGIGHRIGTYFTTIAKDKSAKLSTSALPHPDLAFLLETDAEFKDYVRAIRFAQDYAALNRRLVVDAVVKALRECKLQFTTGYETINCHHNYIAKEKHYGKDLWITRKGAVYAGKGARAVIPGSMGTKSFIVEGKGNEASFNSCAHGAGRVMSRSEAKATISLEEHVKMTEFIECRKDQTVLDESPLAYKDIHAVMAAQDELVTVTEILHPVLVLKG